MLRRSKNTDPKANVDGSRVGQLEEALLNIGDDTPLESVTALLDQLDFIEGKARNGPVPTAGDRRCLLKRRLHWKQFAGRAARVGTLVILLTAALALFTLAAFPDLYAILVDGDTFSVVPSGQTELTSEPKAQYSSLNQAMKENGFPDMAPSWIPSRFNIKWVHHDDYAEITVCSAWYSAAEEEKGLFVRVVGYGEEGAATEKFESGNDGGTIWKHEGMSYYLSYNEDDRIRATWTYGSYLGEVVGSVSEKELKQILESIRYT